jgi:5-formyltetrahydrofolate cyclo-ligase
VPVGTFTCVLLYDDEVGVPVPVEPHDRRVEAAAGPAGITPLRRPAAG